jgi:aminocarboxymuconate-semialdehyde decarboxylase
MRIDVHAHCFPAEYLDRLDRFGGSAVGTDFGRRFNAGNVLTELEARFQLMDRAGVDRQVLSISPQSPYFADRQRAVDSARLANDLFAELVRLHPERFLAFGCLPLPHIEPSIGETARCLDELGMAGLTVTTRVLELSIANPVFDPLFAELDRRAAVLFLHPAGLACGSPLVAGAGLTWPLGAPMEDALAIVELMKAGVTTRYPKLRIIASHLGGFLPFLMRRLDHQAPWFLPAGTPKPSVLARAFRYDTVNAHPPSLRCAVETLGADRLLLGSDFPYWRDDAYDLAVRYIAESGLGAADVAAIQGGNAARLLGL